MSRCNDENRDKLMKFVLNAPFDEFIIAMDCKDGCEQLALLAERAASGEKVKDLLPELEAHMEYWKDCREEFEALVAIIKAEQDGALPTVKGDQA